jgi:hypothetical protein
MWDGKQSDLDFADCFQQSIKVFNCAIHFQDVITKDLRLRILYARPNFHSAQYQRTDKAQNRKEISCKTRRNCSSTAKQIATNSTTAHLTKIVSTKSAINYLLSKKQSSQIFEESKSPSRSKQSDSHPKTFQRYI